MKYSSFAFLSLLTLQSPVFSEGKADASMLTFPQLPPFEFNQLSNLPSGNLENASLEELRTAMIRGNFNESQEAVRLLIRREDKPTVLRLIYAFKRGDATAYNALRNADSLEVVSFLMEDVAHGSMETFYYEPLYADVSIRYAALFLVDGILLGFWDRGVPQETRKWLKGWTNQMSLNVKPILPEMSEAMVEWWSHNHEALMSNRLEKASWLPSSISYEARTYNDWIRIHGKPDFLGVKFPRPREQPIEVPELFEDWATRIVDSAKMDLTYVPLEYDIHSGTNFVESKTKPKKKYPIVGIQTSLAEKSSDASAKLPSNTENTNTSSTKRPFQPSVVIKESVKAEERTFPWLTCACVIGVMLVLVNWMRSRR